MQHLILLHGALGCRNDFKRLLERLPAEIHTFAPNFPGHGKTPFESGFSIASFADYVIGEMDRMRIPSANFFGYSMGGYVALWLAVHHPQRVERVITLGTKLHWDEQNAAREVSRLNPQKMQEKIPAFCAQLAQKHGESAWEDVVRKTAGLMSALGSGEALVNTHWKRIQCAVNLCRGSADQMVSAEECLAVQTQISNCKYTELEGVPHPLEQVEIEKLLACLNS